MDDKEYYSLMNRSNSALIIQQLQNNLNKKNSKYTVSMPRTYTSVELRQGEADAQMLYEKQKKSEE